MKRIHVQISKLQGALEIRELISGGNEKLLITINSQGYELQAFAKIEVWNGAGWEMVWWMPGPSMHTPDNLAYRTVQDSDWQIDRDILLNLAVEILSLSPMLLMLENRG